MFNINELACRVCLEEKEVMICIYDDLEDLNTNLCKLLEKCANLQISEKDIFPKYLCDDCTRELLIASQFREKCCKSNEIFQEILENSKGTDTEEFSNSNDLVEYCREDDVEIDGLIIEDDDHEEHEGALFDEIEPMQEVQNSFLRQSVVEPLKNSELTNEANHEYIIEETTVSEGYSNYLHMNSETSVVKEFTLVEDNIDNTAPVAQTETMNTYVAKSLSTKSKAIPIFKCDICGAFFKQALNLQKHFQKSHGAIHYFTCSKCDHCFSLEKQFYKHFQECSYNSEADVENIKYKSQKVINVTEKLKYNRKCVYCERDFATPFALRMHLRTHTGERPFQCIYCTKSFKTQSHLNVHHKRHTGQADFMCTFCNKTFYEQSNLTVHLRSHTGERPHACTVCNKTFARVFLLQFHMRTHTGEKPFKCNHCDKSFRQHADLSSHITIHTGQKQHTCVICGKSYIKRSHLVKHMRKHQVCTNNTDAFEATEFNKEVSDTEVNSPIDNCNNDSQNSETMFNFNEVLENEGVITHSGNYA